MDDGCATLGSTGTDEEIAMAVQQCPACELRFRSERELEYHLRRDHGERGARLAEGLEETREERRRERRRQQSSAVHRPVRPPR